jgi:RHS repeat-associated protein
VGDTVTLTGAASSDPDGNPLTYRWTLTGRPAGSAAALAGANTASPSFVADRAGSYTASLIVNDGTVDSAADTVVISTTNTAPTANAGPDQTARVGDTVSLTGAASSDPDGNPLSYRWTLTSRPAGSAAALAGANTASPSFVVDQPGNYTASLIVNDGTVDSAADSVTVSTTNSQPTANAGPDQTVRVTDTVTLSGAASTDPDGNPLSYRWTLTSRPAGSAAALLNPNTLNPSFIADRPGNYTASLIVNDGTLDSAADTVTISTINSAPRANAGPDQTARVGDTVQLDGRGSSDVDGDPLTPTWRVVSRPAGSTASLSATGVLQPSFTIDAAGSYVFELIVGDGSVNSAPDTVTVSTTNSPPVARPGNDRSVPLGSTVTLDGSASSDVDGNPLTFAWSLTSRPAGSAAVISSPTAVSASFVADLPGSYVVQLIVNDGTVNSAPASLTVSTLNARPTANAGPDQTVPLGGAVTLNGSASSDPESAPLTYAWSLSSRPAGSTATLSATNVAGPSFTADRPGSYVAQLIVSDGSLNSLPDTVVISTLNSRPLANAGPAQAANTGATVQLDGSASSDADGDALTYAWSLTTRPAGSNATLSSASAANPTFVADVPGSYVAQLIVADATLQSVPATVLVTVSTPNRPPIAAAAATPSTVNVGSPVTLSSAGSSDPDGNPITTTWSLAARPAGSNASVVSPGSANTSFTPDLAGQYIVQLTVSDGSLSASAQANVTANAVVTNRPPVIVTVPGTLATVGASYVYDVDATDPDAGDTLTYALTTAPGNMSINPATGLIGWTPTPAQLGGQAVVVRVADQAGAAVTQSFTITVGAAPTPLQLAATLVPEIANAGETVTLTALVSGGNGGAVTRTATLNGVPLALNASGVATFAAPAAGVHIVSVTATGSPVNGSTSAPQTRQLVLTVRNAADVTAPVASITSPTADSEVLAPVPVRGTASDANIAYYQLLLRPAGTADTAWVEIWRGLASVTNNVLGTLDPSRVNNGVYELGLRVVDVNGRTTSTLIPIEISRDRKIGQFRLSFTDIRADAAGMPLTLTRTYDSLKKDILGDFGWGWSADATDASVRKNMVLGLDWQLVRSGFNQCLRPIGNRRVTVTLPDGGIYRFQARNVPECAFAVPPAVNIVYDPLPLPVGGAGGAAAGAGALEVINTELVEFRGGQLFSFDSLGPWNPTDYNFTNSEGMKYTLREGVGVVSMTDRYGNTVNYGPGGYQHNSALAVQLVRDAQGRITRATDPAGRSLNYAYNTGGELISVTDRLGQITYFQYDTATSAPGAGSSGSTNSAHLLASITDPRGVVVMRTQFDEFGRVAGNTDGNGAGATQTFDETNNLQRVVDRRGNATTYTFDTAGNVTRIVDARGGITDLTYDANGNELTRRDPLGNTVTKTYNAVTGKVLTERDPLGRVTTTTYATTGRDFERQNPISVTDALGRVTSYGYRPGDETFPGAVPSSISEPLGRATTTGQDSAGNMTSLNMGGISTTYVYDTKGRRTRETDALGNVSNYTFDDNGNELTRSIMRTVDGVPRVERMSRAYDSENRLIEETDASGAIRRTTYSAAGQVASTTDALGRTTLYSYDTNSRLVRTTFPDGTYEELGYDANGNKTRSTDRLGRVTVMVYDELNRHVQTQYPDGTDRRMEYDAAGRLTAEVDQRNARLVHDYDAASQQTSSVDASGRRTEHTYDLAGNRTQTRLPDGRGINFTYDALNRLTRSVFPDGSVQQSTYRPDGRKATETDARGVTTTFGYDASGRLTSVQQTGIASATTYGYDEAGGRTLLRDALARQVQWRYDAIGRPLSRTLPNGSIESFAYDAEGQLTSHTTFGGQTITRTYDALGRELTRRVPAAAGSPERTITWTYTAEGQRATQVETGSSSLQGTTTYTYDALNRITQWVGPQGALSWAYDEAGRVTRRTTPEGSTTYAFDGDGRLLLLTAPDGKTTSYLYDAAGRMVRSEQQLDVPAGIVLVTDKRYDGQDRPITIAHSRRVGAATSLLAGQAITRGGGGAVTRIDAFDATASYDNAGGVFVGAPVRVQTFAYDANARVTQESNYKGAQLAAWLISSASPATQATSYTHDAVGNRTSKTVVTAAGTETTAYVYDANDRLTIESLTTATGTTVQTTYAWDGNGNLASKQTPTQYSGYSFDAENRLVAVSRGASQATAAEVVRYSYDADGKLTSKTTPGGTTSYLIDPTTTWPQVVLESRGAERVAYVWGDTLRQQTRGGQGTLFGGTGEDLIPLQGQLGTVLAAADESGLIVETYEFSAFGEPAGAANRLAHQFAGEYRAEETGLTYLRARWYDPSSARLLAQDPLAGTSTKPKSLNRYVYADSDPVNRVDPDGRMSMGEISVAQNISSTLTNVSLRLGYLYNIYERFNAVLGFFELINAAVQVMGSGTTFTPADAVRSVGLNGVDFGEAFESAARNFPRAIATGIGDWSRGYSTSFQKGKRVTGALLYMPLVSAGIPGSIAVTTPARIRFGKEKVPLKLVFGGPGGASGTLGGVGLEMGSLRQLVRMDYHVFNAGHGGATGLKPNELAVIRDGSFHFHVNKWNQ